MRKESLQIPRPSVEEVDKYLIKWDNQGEKYLTQQRVLDNLFEQHKKNDNIEDILLKACVLNNFYSTNIFAIFNVADRIKELRIDDRLANGYDSELVNDIAKVAIEVKNKKTGKTEVKEKNFYSFATKYCAHHNHELYPIYDSYVHKVLAFFQKQDNFYREPKLPDYKLPDLKKYDNFHKVLIGFQKSYGIDQYNLREMDKYLWLLGKEYFPKNFNKPSDLDSTEEKSYNKVKKKQA